MSVPQRTVLVCEDCDEDFDTLIDAVRMTGLAADVRRATTGGKCLEWLRAAGSAWPAVLLLDLNTPGTDGRAALETIKSDPGLKDLPVVVITTSSNPKDVDFCYKAGANAYHVKPILHPEYLRTLQQVLTYWLGHVTLPRSQR